jgi:primosomal protein N' (replication factor Y)
VTLVGVMLADTGMYVNDFRASEHTFSLLTQVIGRAGRASSPGRAIIQTFSPDNDVIRLAQKQDYRAFYASEIQLREQMCFPPFCDMVQLTLSCADEKRLFSAAKDCADHAISLAEGGYRDIPLQMFGPMEAQVYKMAEQFRLRLMFKCRWNPRARALFRQLLTDSAQLRGISCAIDVNPMHA